MATKKEKMENYASKATKPGRRFTYPWGKWFNGKTHTLTKGKDFKSAPITIVNLARRTAKKFGATVHSITSDKKTVTMKVTF